MEFNIVTLEHKGLKKTALLDLGNINIVCGKNNSGKTTLLEAIAGEHTGRYAIRIDECNSKQISESLCEAHNYTGRIVEAFKELFLDVGKQNELWIAEDVNTFAHEVGVGKASNSILANKNLNVGILKGLYKALFGGKLKTLLVPSKRLLTMPIGINPEEQILPNGIGVINALFTAKNQNDDTESYQKYAEVKSAFKEISNGCKFSIVIDGRVLTINFIDKKDVWRNGNDSGQGLHELLIILFYCVFQENDLTLVEEPENHIHPEMQRRLLSYISQISSESRRYFFSTHSNIFLDNAFVDKVYFTAYNEDVVVSDATSRAELLDDLGYSVTDNLVSDLVILVEGPSDVPILEEFLKMMGLYGKYNIKMWPLGGDIMDQLDLSVLQESYNLIALIDNDPGSSRVRNRFIERCNEYSIEVVKLSRYAIENYFSVDAVMSVFGGQISEPIVEIEHDRPLFEQIGINVKKSNRKIAEIMTINDVAETDFGEFLLRVKEKVESI